MGTESDIQSKHYSASPEQPQLPPLTKKLFSNRELEIIKAVALGLSNDEIGQRLYISTGTVKWHLNNIYTKLEAKNRTEAIRKAVSLGLLSP